MQNTAIVTIAKSLPTNKDFLLNYLISNSYIPHTDLRKNLKTLIPPFLLPCIFRDMKIFPH